MPAKKAAAKKAATKKVTPKAPVADASDKKLTALQVAKKLDAGSRHWGTGRERDNALVAEGYDLKEIDSKLEDVRRKRLTGA